MTVDVILPCLDEAAALPWVLERMPAGFRAIVVDNGSADGSGQLARSLGATVVPEPRRGFGAAAHAGVLAATADLVCFCDCDGSLDPQQLPRLASRELARRVRRHTGVRLGDLGPMRAARREALLGLNLTDRRFGYPLEMVLSAAAAGWRLAEVDVDYLPRIGKSKVTGTVRGSVRTVRDMSQVLAR
ncbi:MAG: glycosyltransferase [Streptosporangiaceae bacterium]